MKKQRMKRLNWKIIESNVREAREELENLEKRIADKNNLSEIGLQCSLQHAYHHLNFAWHIRRQKTARYAHLTKKDFDRWRRFPTNFWWS